MIDYTIKKKLRFNDPLTFTESHILYDCVEKLEQIEQIVNRPTGSSEEEKAYNYMMQVIDIKEVLEQENVDKTCDNCKYHTDAEEIHGKTPCGTCGQELINFCRKG